MMRSTAVSNDIRLHMHRLLAKSLLFLALVCIQPAAPLYAIESSAAAHATNHTAWRGQSQPDAPLSDPDTSDAEPDEADAAGLRLLLPLVGRNSTLTTLPPSPLPMLANPSFDAAGGWIELQDEVSFSLITVPAAGNPIPELSVPTARAIAWLGGIDGQAVVHRIFQSVALPNDYTVQVSYDLFTQSAEAACGLDSAGLFINGVQVDGAFNFCTAQATNAWVERTANLAAFRGQVVTIEFRMVTNQLLNSNLYLDNASLCGTHIGLPVAQRCQPAGWGEVGGGAAQATGISPGLRDGREPSVAISMDGRPWAAWQGTSGGSPEIFVKRWNGVVWEAVGGSASGGGISNNSGVSAEPSLAIAPSGTPYVAWHDFSSGDGEIYVRRWSGAAWEEVGPGSATGGGVSNGPNTSFGASLAIAPDGTPWLAWTNVAGANNEIHVKRFDGVAWVEAGAGSATGGGISSNAGKSEDPALAIGSDGTIMLAWADDSSGDFEIYAKRWTGSSWQSVGTTAASDGGVSNNSEASLSPALVVNVAGDAMVAWVDRGGGDTEIYARRWNGTVWVEAGAGSASGGGISNNAGDSVQVALAGGRDGRVVAAWTDRSGGAGEEVYVRRWDGTAWQQVGAGSASGGGISLNPTFSSEATVAVAPDHTPYVLWSNGASNGYAIYARRYAP